MEAIAAEGCGRRFTLGRHLCVRWGMVLFLKSDALPCRHSALIGTAWASAFRRARPLRGPPFQTDDGSSRVRPSSLPVTPSLLAVSSWRASCSQVSRAFFFSSRERSLSLTTSLGFSNQCEVRARPARPAIPRVLTYRTRPGRRVPAPGSFPTQARARPVQHRELRRGRPRAAPRHHVAIVGNRVRE